MKLMYQNKELVSGSGGKPVMLEITLTADGWTAEKTQTVAAPGVLADESSQMILPTPAAASQTAYYQADVLCVGQGADSLTFRAETVPTEDMAVYVAVTEVKGGDL